MSRQSRGDDGAGSKGAQPHLFVPPRPQGTLVIDPHQANYREILFIIRQRPDPEILGHACVLNGAPGCAVFRGGPSGAVSRKFRLRWRSFMGAEKSHCGGLRAAADQPGWEEA